MGTVLEDVTSNSIDATYIQRRVDDWEKRLNGLYSTIGDWLPDGWMESPPGRPCCHARAVDAQVRHGRETDADAQAPRPRKLRDRASHAVRLEPRGLWIMGGNGRVDLKGGRRRYLIVDMAENFEAPDWQAAHTERRCDREAVTPGWLRRALQ